MRAKMPRHVQPPEAIENGSKAKIVFFALALEKSLGWDFSRPSQGAAPSRGEDSKTNQVSGGTFHPKDLGGREVEMKLPEEVEAVLGLHRQG